MPPKHKGTPDAVKDTAFNPSEPKAKRKKLGERFAFPRFEDGDVVISLGSASEDDLVLYRRDLSRMCEYFKKFDETGWPERFVLQPSPDVAECRVVPVSPFSDSMVLFLSDLFCDSAWQISCERFMLFLVVSDAHGSLQVGETSLEQHDQPEIEQTETRCRG